jgi:hypothetical protein
MGRLRVFDPIGLSIYYMASRELKRLSNTHGFEVAKRSEKTARHAETITTRMMATRAEFTTTVPEPTTVTPVKKKKKKNPYSGASGPFARKHKWAVRKKRKPPPALDLEAVVPTTSIHPDTNAASNTEPSSPVTSRVTSPVSSPNSSPVV